jgi:hypothetical protein
MLAMEAGLSTVGVDTGQWLDIPEIVVWIPAGAKFASVPQSAQIISGAHPWVFYSPSTGCSFPGCEADGTRNRLLRCIPDVKSSWCYTSSPPYGFVAYTGTTSLYPSRHAAKCFCFEQYISLPLAAVVIQLSLFSWLQEQEEIARQ